jgi:ribosomal protein S18 acetylase RimI-like enzyme
MAIEIRAAIPVDYDALCALTEQVDALHCDNVGQIFQRPRGPTRDRDYILGLIEGKEVGIYVAEAASVVIGFVHIAVYESPPISIFVPRRYAVVENLVVDQRFQRAGVGRALMERAHQWAVGQRAGEVELTVYDFNETALAFYESLGYEIRSRRMYLPLEKGSS